MRTTLDIDEDVLKVAREIAQARKQSIGKVISDTVRKNLAASNSLDEVVNGIYVIPTTRDSSPITLELVNKLRDED